MLDAIITADTGWERKATYEIREWYSEWLSARGLEVHIVSVGNVKEMGGEDHIHIPFWTANGAPLRRQCTREFKIRPIRRKSRELAGYDPTLPPHPPPGEIEQWLGISLDEYTRMKGSQAKFVINRFPLIERRFTRTDCIEFLREHDLPVPVKSSCIGCPYRRASEWMEMKETDPQEFAEAVAFDEANRHNPLAGRDTAADDRLYVYKAAQPLATADLAHDARREKKSKQLPLLCEPGYCHV